MRIYEEDCNMVLLAGVTLMSVAVAGAAALLESASAASKSKPAYVSSAVAPALGEKQEKQSSRLADRTPVRVVGAPFVPNTNPRER
jgi:hypothetical protein